LDDERRWSPACTCTRILILSLTLFFVVYITLVNLKRYPVETATMSDVAPTANVLA